jgi:hypothetical protein
MALRPRCCRPPNPPQLRRQPIPVVRRRPDHLPYTVRIGRLRVPHIPPRYPWPPPLIEPPWLPEPPVIPQRYRNPRRQATVFREPARRALPRAEPNHPHGHNILHAELHNAIGIYPFLNWDIKNFPSTSTRRSTPIFDAVPSFRHSATNPGSTSVQIHYTHPTFLPFLTRLGPINVYPLGNAADIKVEDILNAIYSHFHQPITMHEWNTLSWQEREQISDSCRGRIKQAYDMCEANGGLLRVDALKGCTRFAGLSLTSHLNRSSQLHLELVPH